MALLDPIKTKINEVNKIAMEEFDIMSSLDEDEDIILEAALRGEEAIIGNGDEDLDESDIEDEDFDSGDITESEDPDLGEDDDNVDFSFESTIPTALESVLNDFDEEDEFDPTMDDEDDIDELFDEVMDDMKETNDDEEDEEDDF